MLLHFDALWAVDLARGVCVVTNTEPPKHHVIKWLYTLIVLQGILFSMHQ